MSRLRWTFRSNATGSPSTPTGSMSITGGEKDGDLITDGNGMMGEVIEERFFGLENFGNTCYCNSVLQALYHCPAFRSFITSYPNPTPANIPIGPTPSQIAEALANPPPTAVDSPTIASVPPERGTPKRTWSVAGRKQNEKIVPQVGGGLGASPSVVTANRTPPPLGGQSLQTPEAPQVPNYATQAAAVSNGPPPTLLSAIQSLFSYVSTSPPHPPPPPKAVPPGTQTSGGPIALGPHSTSIRGGGPHGAGTLGRGVARPDELVRTVRRENELFRSTMHQDAHEFLGWLLNKVAEDVEGLDRENKGKNGTANGNAGGQSGKTFIHTLFEGTLTNETRCLTCETTSSRDESFLDLSIDIEKNSSVTACLRQFSASEMLCQKNKFFCDTCCGLQEAEKRMKIRKLPNVLALHLKRFKYQEQVQRYIKLSYRVVFPFQLKLFNTTDDVADPDRLYELFAVVVHIGIGPHQGHYVAIVRSQGRWVLCDDENVEPIEETDIPRYFGDYPAGSGYVLFYQAVDLDLASLGLKSPSKQEPESMHQQKEVDPLVPNISDDQEEVLTADPDQEVFAAGALSPAGLTVDIPIPTEWAESPLRRMSSPPTSSASIPNSFGDTPARQRQDSAPADSDFNRKGAAFGTYSGGTSSLSSSVGQFPTPPTGSSDASGSTSKRKESSSSGGNWFTRRTGKDKEKEKAKDETRTSMYTLPTAARTQSTREGSFVSTSTATSYGRHIQHDPADTSIIDYSDTGGLGLSVNSLSYGGPTSNQTPPRAAPDSLGTPANMSSSFMSSASGVSALSSANGNSPASPSLALGSQATTRPGLSTSATFSTLAGLGRKPRDKEGSGERERVPSGSSLTRKLSVGLPGKSTLTRTSSAAFKSMGFGKKDKNKSSHVTLDEAEESTGLMRRD